MRHTPQLTHDQLQEEQRRFGGLFVLGEIALDAFLFLTAEGRIGEDWVDAVALADVGKLEAEKRLAVPPALPARSSSSMKSRECVTARSTGGPNRRKSTR